MNLKRAMVRANLLGVHGKEKGVVIYPFFFSVDVHECGHYHAIWGSQ